MQPIRLLILMGVAGSGKTTIGRLLAERMGWAFQDADDYHSVDDIAKMRMGIPLTDEDRAPWLETLRRDVVEPSLATGEPAILACSALKAAYLDRLGAADPRVRVVCLTGDFRLIRERMERRNGALHGRRHAREPVPGARDSARRPGRRRRQAASSDRGRDHPAYRFAA